MSYIIEFNDRKPFL